MFGTGNGASSPKGERPFFILNNFFERRDVQEIAAAVKVVIVCCKLLLSKSNCAKE
jgi:hypothetical protein